MSAKHRFNCAAVEFPRQGKGVDDRIGIGVARGQQFAPATAKMEGVGCEAELLQWGNEISPAKAVRWVRDSVADSIGVNRGDMRYWTFTSGNTSVGIDPGASVFFEGRWLESRISGAEHDFAECAGFGCSRCHSFRKADGRDGRGNAKCNPHNRSREYGPKQDSWVCFFQGVLAGRYSSRFKRRKGPDSGYVDRSYDVILDVVRYFLRFIRILPVGEPARPRATAKRVVRSLRLRSSCDAGEMPGVRNCSGENSSGLIRDSGPSNFGVPAQRPVQFAAFSS
jgi:hypothetical protein